MLMEFFALPGYRLIVMKYIYTITDFFIIIIIFIIIIVIIIIITIIKSCIKGNIFAKVTLVNILKVYQNVFVRFIMFNALCLYHKTNKNKKTKTKIYILIYNLR